MNYFAHARHFLDAPYFVAGTAVPDWLAVADRGVRVRSKHAQALLDDPDPLAVAVARGILQHFRDDARFHETQVFAELSLELTLAARDLLDDESGTRESGMRPRFLGHLLVELLLDASLVAEDPNRLKTYYRVLASVEGHRVQEALNRMAPRPTDRLTGMILGFCRDQFLWDYLEDDTLFVRLNQVMRRVKLSALPESFRDLLPSMRKRVTQCKTELLSGIPA
jgi:hypothetical protein